MRQAEKAKAKITDPAHDRFWGGYSGYFMTWTDTSGKIDWNPLRKSRIKRPRLLANVAQARNLYLHDSPSNLHKNPHPEGE